MNILKELSKHDKKWREIAFKICNNKMLADDLTNDMYLRLMHFKNFTTPLVRTTLKNLFIDDIRKNKKQKEHSTEIQVTDVVNEINDYEKRVLNRFYNLPELTQALIKGKAEHSFRELEEDFGVYPMKIYREIKNAKKFITDEK